MKYLRIAVWASLLTLCMMLPAHADPVTAAIGMIAGVLKAGGVATALIKIAFGIALKVGSSLLQKAMMKTQPEPGITGQIQLGGDRSLSFIVGTYATAGHLEYSNTHGNVNKTPNAVLTQVITVSDLPVHSIGNTVIVNGERCERDPSLATSDEAAKFGVSSYPIKEYKHDRWWFLFCKYYLGTQLTADPNLVAAYRYNAKPWTADMIGRGIAYVIATAEVQRKLMTAIPSFRFEVQGILLYDPRKDSSVGGNGSQRWGQENTYQWSDNPAVIIYNIMRGIYYQGTYIYGPEIPAHNLPLLAWIAAMNECDLPVKLESGGTEKQFRCGYEIKTLEHEPVDVIGELLKACNGRMAEIGGVYKIHVGAAPLPVAFVSDAEFVVTEEQKLDAFHGLESTFNGVTATYPEREAGWEMKDAPQRRFPEFENEDGGRILLADVQLNAVPFASQVQRLMKSLALENRRFRTMVGTLFPWAFVLEPLDVISYTSLRNGYINKSFILTAIDDQANVNQTVSLVEVDPSDYDWLPSTDTLPWSVGSMVPEWPEAQIMTGWQVQPAVLIDNLGRERKPSIEVFYDGDMADVRAVRVQVRLPVIGQVMFDGEIPYGEPDTPQKSTVLNGGFSPNVLHEVRGKYVPFSGRDSEWSAWLSVKTDDIRLGGLDLYPFDVDSFNESFQQILRDEADNKRYIRDEITRVSTALNDFTADGEIQRQGIREVFSVELGESRSEYRRLILVEASERVALSTRIEVLDVQFSDRIATVTEFSQATANAVSALSQSMIETNVKLGAISADGHLRIFSEANQAGSLSRIVLTTSATANGPPVQGVIVLEAIGGGKSRAIIEADGVYITSGSTRRMPFAIIGGKLYANELYVNWARIEDVSIGTAQIANGAITSAKIGDLQVKTSNLDFNQVTQPYEGSSNFPTSGGISSGFIDILTLQTQNPQANTSFAEVNANLSVVRNSQGANGSVTVRFINKTTGNVFATESVLMNSTSAYYIRLVGLFIDTSASIGLNNYAIQVSSSNGAWNPINGGGSGKIKCLVWKR